MTRLEQIMVKMGFDVSESSKVKDAMDKVNHETKKAGEGIAGFNTHGREMHELIHKIGAQSPLLGSALKAAFNPEALGIIALVAVIEFVVEKFRQLKEEAKAAAEAAIERWKAHNEAMRDAAEAAENFRKKWEDIAEASAKASEPYKGQMKMLDQMIQQHEEVLSLLEAQELAAAKGDKAQEDAIKKRYQNLREQAGETSDAGRATLMRKRIADLVKDRDEAFEKAHEAQSKTEKLKSRPPQVDREMLKEEQASLEKETEKYQRAKQELDEVALEPDAVSKWAAAKDREIIRNYEAKLQRIKELTGFTQKYDDTLKKAQEDFDKYSKLGADRDKESIAVGQELRAILDKPTAAQTRKEAADLQKQMTPTGTALAKIKAVTDTLANDDQLQQALARVARAQSPAEKQYWQNIVDARNRYDRSLFPGVPTAQELKNKPEQTFDQEMRDYLKSIDSTLKGD